MIKMYQKNDYSAKIIYKENGVPVDVTGWEYVFIIKSNDDKFATDNKALLKKRQVINSGNGEFFINLYSDEVSVPAGVHVCQILLTRINPDNGFRQNKTLYTDKVTVYENIVKEV